MKKLINLFRKKTPIEIIYDEINHAISNNIKKLELNVDNIDTPSFLVLFNELRDIHLLDCEIKTNPHNQDSEYLVINLKKYNGRRTSPLKSQSSSKRRNNPLIEKFNRAESLLTIIPEKTELPENVISFADFKNKKKGTY
jgi:hypothetical protein